MTDDAPPTIPAEEAISPEDLAQLLASSGMPMPGPPPSKSAMRRKLLIAVLIASIGVGASVLSCVGQSFSYRQAHAQEGIEQQLQLLRLQLQQGCSGSQNTTVTP